MKNNQLNSSPNQKQWGHLIYLQQKLMQVWEEFNVDEYYQKIILGYFDTLPDSQTKWVISKEISDTHQRISLYFKLTQRRNLRNKSLSELEQSLLSQDKTSKADSLLLSKICHQLKELRKNNLMIAQIIIQMSNQYIPSEDLIPSECKEILVDLDKENNFIKCSWLKEYIIFQYGYDPFLLYHYDMKGKQNPQRSSEIIDKLFTLSISQYCRLFKVKNIILEILGSRRFNFSEVIRNKKILDPITTLIPNSLGMASNRTKIVSRNLIESRQKPNNLRKNSFSLKKSNYKQQPQKYNYSPTKLQKINYSKEPERDNRNKYRYSLNDMIERDSIPQINARNCSKTQECYDDLKQNWSILKQSKQDIQKQQESQYNQSSHSNYRIKNYPNLRQQIHKKMHTDKNDSQKEWSIKKSLPIIIKSQQINQNIKYNNPKQLYKDSEVSEIVKRQYGMAQNKKQQDSNDMTHNNKVINQQQKIASQLTNRIASGVKKEIKIKGFKFTHSQLVQYLLKYRFKKQIQQRLVESQKWLQSLIKCQSYICQLLINNQSYAIAISMILPGGDYLIKLWAPSQQCSIQNSIFLLKKYLDYLEKYTSTKEIYYNGDEIEEIIVCKFIRSKENVYSRKRIIPVISKQQQYQSYLSLKSSNIYVEQRKQMDLFYSKQIQSFSNQHSFVSISIANIDKTMMSKNILTMVKINQNIPDIKTLNSLLKKQQMDTYNASSSFQTKNIQILRVNFSTPFTIPFLVGQGYFHFFGQQIFTNGRQLICGIKCQKDDSRMLFGKGFSNIKQFMNKLKQESVKVLQFSVKMFYKQLYGKIRQQGVKNGCYGNVQISLFWQDQLQGRLRHNITNCEYFGPEIFFVGIEIKKQIIYCFQVKDEDILF